MSLCKKQRKINLIELLIYKTRQIMMKIYTICIITSLNYCLLPAMEDNNNIITQQKSTSNYLKLASETYLTFLPEHIATSIQNDLSKQILISSIHREIKNIKKKSGHTDHHSQGTK